MTTSPLALTCVGIVVGFLMGLTSCTGAIIVPALVLGFALPQARAQGTAIALTMSPLQLPALFSFARNGNIDWRFVRWMAPGVLVGCFVGATVAQALSPMLLKSVFGMLLVYLGAYMLMMLTTSDVTKAVVMAFVVTLGAGAMVGLSHWHETAKTAAVAMN